ncbi:MAG: LPS export ABC transporter periplasmic protein LptC [Pseudomonadota bacterium]|nr:LPS export ABC transporter periplasmic protein LptC [Pseudomonadota bacterium]
MANENGTRKSGFSFAPREQDIDAGRQPVRASILFISLGLVLTFVTVLWLGFFTQPAEIKLEVTDVKIDDAGDIELTGAIYKGRTENGEAFEVTAKIASERSSGAVDMESPTAQLFRNDGDLIDLSSQNGLYFPDSSRIELDGDVVMTSQDMGLTLLALSLSANLADGSMFSEEPVRVERSDGFVTANAMEVTGKGKRIIFKGDARMTLQDNSQSR